MIHFLLTYLQVTLTEETQTPTVAKSNIKCFTSHDTPRMTGCDQQKADECKPRQYSYIRHVQGLKYPFSFTHGDA